MYSLAVVHDYSSKSTVYSLAVVQGGQHSSVGGNLTVPAVVHWVQTKTSGR